MIVLFLEELMEKQVCVWREGVAEGWHWGADVHEHNLPCRACGWLPVHPHCLLGVAECFMAESFHPQSFGREVGLPMA